MELDLTQVLEDRPTKTTANKEQIGSLTVGSTEHQINKGTNKIGRSLICDIVLSDPTVSKVHAEIQGSSEVTFIADLRSANGTVLKKLPLRQFFFYQVADGDIIQFGDVKAIYKATKGEESAQQRDDVTPSRVENLNQSIIPGSQRNTSKRQLFRKPGLPIDRRKNKDGASNRDEGSGMDKENDESELFDDSMDIHQMETQRTEHSDITDSITKRRVTAMDVNDAENIHELETQDILDNPFRTKKPRLESSSNVNAERYDDSVFEAETQVSMESCTLRDKSSTAKRVSDGKKHGKTSKTVPVDDYEGNIFEAETQISMESCKPPDKSCRARKNPDEEKRETTRNKTDASVDGYEENIFEAETQVSMESFKSLDKSSRIRKNPDEEKRETTRNNTDSPVDSYEENIFEAKTQIFDGSNLPMGFCKLLDNSRARNDTDEANREKTPKRMDVDDYEDNIFEAETQVSMEVPRLPGKRSRIIVDSDEEKEEITCKKINTSKDHSEDNIFEAETQVFMETSRPEQISKTKTNVSRHLVRSNKKNKKDESHKKSHVIAETDDESETDDEVVGVSKAPKNDNLSDESVTDGENELEPLSRKIAEEEKSQLSLASSNQEESKNSGKSQSERSNFTDETDFDLLPTQVLNVPTSTPMSRRWSSHEDEESIVESQAILDIHEVVTQASEVEKIADTKTQNELRRSEERSKSPDEVRGNANDSIDSNLGKMFGKENAYQVESMDEPTQLMTQNLVDILKPTQNFVPETEATSSTRRISDDDDTNGPDKSKTMEFGTLGFVNGEAVRNEISSTSSSTTPEKEKSKGEERKKAEDASADLANGELRGLPVVEDEDILFGLPEVNICGTVSYPGSPAPSETDSDTTDSESSLIREIFKKRAISAGNSGSKTPKVSVKTRESMSPILPPKKSRPGEKRDLLKTFPDDTESEDDLDYSDLKKIADELLASGSTNVAMKSQKKIETRSKNFSRSTVAKASSIVDQSALKLSKTSSSLIVTDTSVRNCTVDLGESKIDESSSLEMKKRPRQAATKIQKQSKAMKKESTEESTDEKFEIPMSLKFPLKTYARVRLTRFNESEVKPKKNNDSVQSKNEVSQVTPKSRKSTSKTIQKSISSPALQSPSKSRRTINSSISTKKQQYNILFTGVKDENHDKIVMRLGGSIVTDPAKATVLITDKIRRTFKFLCAVAQGINVVSVNWLIESEKAGNFLDWEKYILKDSAAEAKYKFKLVKSLSAASTKKLLEGFTIITTPKVNQPEIHEIKGMVEACGGRLLVRAPRAWDEKMVIISTENDLAAAKALLSKSPKSLKISVQSTEFLLTGILRQEINLVDHRLL